MTPAVRNIVLNAPFSPYRLPGLAARYSLDGAPSDSTYLIDGSNRLMLVADRSGNSGVNGLVLNGVSGNYASTPDSATIPLGDVTIEVDAAATDWTPASTMALCAHDGAGGNRSMFCGFQTDTGTTRLRFIGSTDGTNVTAINSSAVTVSDFQRIKARFVRTAATGNVDFSYSTNGGQSWTSAGSGTSVSGTLFNSTAALEAGSSATGASALLNGTVYSVRIYSDTTQTTLAFDADFTRVAKLASSFTESSANAATVTINTSGDTGARICGARDLYQGTQANQPIFSVSGGYNIATFDGSNDYLKTAPFSLSQPETVYFVGSQVTWANDVIFDGNVTASGRLSQSTSTPQINLDAGGTSATTTAFAVGARGVVRATLAGSVASLGINLNTPITASGTGSAAMNGLTVACRGAGDAFYANITVSEILIFSAAHDAATQLRIANYLIRNQGIAV